MKTAQIREMASAFWSGQEGVTSIEYALLGALIAVVIASTVTQVGTSVLALFARVVAAFP